ncbi:MAG: RHS repeat-associated core domain-containing protein, partial [bacterium]
ESKLVTVEWEVVPTIIEDKYEVKITTTFETDVPAAVVVVEPAGITLPDMEVGQVYNGELTLTNHGLVRAEELNYTFPESDKYYDYEPLAAIPETLEAKQQIIVPYRITCLAKLGEESAESSGGSGGGGGYNYQKRICFDYCYTPCPNEPENIVCDTICSLISKIKVDNETSTSDSQLADFIYGQTYQYTQEENRTNKSVDEAPKAQELRGENISCREPEEEVVPEMMDGALERGPCNPDYINYDREPQKCNFDEKGRNDCTYSHVSLLTGRYSFAVTGLYFKVNNLTVDITRIYNDRNWYLSYDKDPIYLHKGPCPDDVSLTPANANHLEKGGVIYNRDSDPIFCYYYGKPVIMLVNGGLYYTDPVEEPFNYIFSNNDYIIKTLGGVWTDYCNYNIDQYDWEGFLFKSPSGFWKEYNKSGELIAYGDRSTNRIEIHRTSRINHITDATGRVIINFEYEDSALKAVEDMTGRRVEYRGGHYPTEIIDAMGNTWSYTYDDKRRIIGKTDPSGNTIHINYNVYNKVESVLDDDGNGHYYEYDYDSIRQEYYASILTSEGVYIERYFNKDGDLTKELINGQLNREIAYDYRTRVITTQAGTTIKKFDEWDNLKYIQHPDGTSHSYLYNKYSELLEEIDENGVVTKYEYDDRSNQTKMREGYGTANERITSYTYDNQGKGNLECITLPDSSEIKMEYDDYGHLVKVTDAENNITEYTYDDLGNITSKKDASGNIWQYEYDKKNHLILETDPLYYETRYEYDAVGDLRAIIDAQSNRTEYTYDSHHNIKEIQDALGEIIRYEYNADGHIIEYRDQMNNSMIYEYDNVQRRSTLTDPAGNIIKYDYEDVVSFGCTTCASGDAVDKPSTIIYPTYTKHLEYDPMGRVVKEVDVLDENTSHETLYTYDAVGNLIEMTDAEGNTTTYEYDVLVRLIKVTDAEGGVTQYGYDIRDNLISVTDAEGNMTTFTYDRNGNKTGERRHLGQEYIYGHDSRGNLSSIIDAKDQKAVYTYDAAQRLTLIEYYSSSTDHTADKTVIFDYDLLGNLLSYDDGVTSATYNYDALSRKVGETVNYGDFTLSYSYAYNPDGTKKSFIGPDDVTSDYSYTDGQLSTIHIAQVGDITFGDHRWLSPTSVDLPGGTVMNLEYDPLQRIKTIQSQDASNDILMDYHYVRDTVGNIVSKATEYGSYIYSYDKTYQLLSADNPPNTMINDETYTYDKVGNRLSESSIPGEWHYNENNQLIAIDGVNFKYDENENMIQKVVDGQIAMHYIYDIEDRLVRAEDENDLIIAKYYYDPFGRRLWKEVEGVRTYFFYSDEGLIGEYDVSGNEIKGYGYVPDSMWTTDPVYIKIGGSYYFYQNDHLGTPQKIIDAWGDVVWVALYDSFGNCEIMIKKIENNLRFPGQYYDEETGLYYNYHRYYEPIVSRYLQLDPIGIDSNLNLYLYGNNNPVNLIDSLGLYVGGIGLGASGGIAGIVSPGLFGKGSIRWVHDHYGNWGIVACAGFGISAGTGVIGGLQTSHLPGVDSICDLEKTGPTLNLIGKYIGESGGGAGGGLGPGIAVSGGRSGLSVITGVGIGAYGTAFEVVGGCKLLYSRNKCKKKECK